MTKRLYITYVGEKAYVEVSPRRRTYCFERFKTQPIGFKRDEINPKDADILSRKITGQGKFLFYLE